MTTALMAFLTPVLAVQWINVVWNVLGLILVVISLLMIVIILIQDSKGAGLTSAFGAGPGGESLLGARMQRDVARWTAYFAVIFAAVVISMGLLGNCRARYGSAGSAGAKTPVEKTESAPGSSPAPAPPGPPEGAGASSPSGAAPAGTPATPPAVTPPAGTPPSPAGDGKAATPATPPAAPSGAAPNPGGAAPPPGTK